MRVHLGSDHAGHELRLHLIGWLHANGYETVDHGPQAFDPEDDYPAFCLAAAQGVVDEPGSLGVVLGGSGNGEAIAANKVDGARCAVVWREDLAQLARQHNDANLMSLGARMHPAEDAVRFLQVFLTTAFSTEPRHARRIGQLREYEAQRPSA